MFKDNNENAGTICGICSKFTTIKKQYKVINFALVSLLSTLNIFGTLFWCFHCWLWTTKYWMGPFMKFWKTRIPEKSGKVTCLAFERLSRTSKFFNGDYWKVSKLKQFLTQTAKAHNKNLIFVTDSYGGCCSLIHSQDMFCKFTQINPFPPALFYGYQWRHVSLKYMLSILFSLGIYIAHAFYWNNLSLDELVVTKIFPTFFENFKIYQLHKKLSYKMSSSNLKI